MTKESGSGVSPLILFDAGANTKSEMTQQLRVLFDQLAPITITYANLPHWKQVDVTYFVTYVWQTLFRKKS